MCSRHAQHRDAHVAAPFGAFWRHVVSELLWECPARGVRDSTPLLWCDTTARAPRQGGPRSGRVFANRWCQRREPPLCARVRSNFKGRLLFATAFYLSIIMHEVSCTRITRPTKGTERSQSTVPRASTAPQGQGRRRDKHRLRRLISEIDIGCGYRRNTEDPHALCARAAPTPDTHTPSDPAGSAPSNAQREITHLNHEMSVKC